MRCTLGSRGGTGSCAHPRPSQAQAFVFEVPDGAAGVPARVGATRPVMSYLINGAKLDPKMRASICVVRFDVAWGWAAVSGRIYSSYYLE